MRVKYIRALPVAQWALLISKLPHKLRAETLHSIKQFCTVPVSTPTVGLDVQIDIMHMNN